MKAKKEETGTIRINRQLIRDVKTYVTRGDEKVKAFVENILRKAIGK